MQAERLDGSVLLAGCDKSLPGMLMAAARLDLASVFLYAGTILPGNARMPDGSQRTVNIVDAFEAVGACARGLMPRADVDGGPIALVRDGDPIVLDIANATVDLGGVDTDELPRRGTTWAPRPPRYTRGVLAKYIKLVGSASRDLRLT
jgi:dihydroxyacid dehydratase/phosphogluconate dehydratase